MSNVIVECQNLTKEFIDGAARIEVLSNVNFSVSSGETVAIIGASGSGKSTLLHLLAGLDTPTKGSVSLGGQDMFKLGEKKRGDLRNEKLGFVYQFHHLLAEFSALENVALPLLMRKTVSTAEAKERAALLLERVGLKTRMTHRPGQLSGGERQRAAIARALVTNPSCVLADEPTGNLDQKTAAGVYELMLELNQQFSTSLVLVTHDETLARKAGSVYRLVTGSLSLEASEKVSAE